MQDQRLNQVPVGRGPLKDHRNQLKAEHLYPLGHKLKYNNQTDEEPQQ